MRTATIGNLIEDRLGAIRQPMKSRCRDSLARMHHDGIRCGSMQMLCF